MKKSDERSRIERLEKRVEEIAQHLGMAAKPTSVSEPLRDWVVPLEHEKLTREEVAERCVKAAEKRGYRADRAPMWGTYSKGKTHFMAYRDNSYCFHDHECQLRFHITLEGFEEYCGVEQPKNIGYIVLCSKEEYPEVKEILEQQGYKLWGDEWMRGEDCVAVNSKKEYLTSTLYISRDPNRPEYTLPQLREEYGIAKTKTRLEWLNELPDGYRERAVANCRRGLDKKPSDECGSMYEAIEGMCDWRETPEDYVFWDGVHSHYEHGTPLPPLPVQVYEDRFSFEWGNTSLILPDESGLFYANEPNIWGKIKQVHKPQPHTLTPVKIPAKGRFYLIKGCGANHFSSYALCLEEYSIRAVEKNGVVLIELVDENDISNFEVTPVNQ